MFEKFINNLIGKFQLTDDIRELLCSPISVRTYLRAFTIIDYEVFEQLGDAIINKFIVCYSYQKYPFLNSKEGVNVVARVRIKYASSQFLSSLADDLGFWPNIVLDELQEDVLGHRKQAILEDVFEAFLGATESIIDSKMGGHGIGYIICFQILQTIYDKIRVDITYENLFDSKTRLKELCDFYKQKLCIIYKTHKLPDGLIRTVISYTIDGISQKPVQSDARTRSDAEQLTASIVLKELNNKGYTKLSPEIFNKIEQFNA